MKNDSSKIIVVKRVPITPFYEIDYEINQSKMFKGISDARYNSHLREHKRIILRRAIKKACGTHSLKDIPTLRIAQNIAKKLLKHQWIKKVKIYERP